jgi:tripartite-type tricarboxylate transporter receptor subunit TctC
MMGKRIALVFDSYSGIAGAIEAGNARPLAVASDKRVALFPDLPTAAETLPGFESNGWQVLVAPVGTPDAVVRKANADLKKALADPEVQERLAKLGRTDTPMSPEETLAFIHGEQKKWAPILTQLGGPK